MKSYSPKRDPRVMAVQFFRKKPPMKLVDKVWAERWGDVFVCKKKDRSSNKDYSEQYVLKDQNQFLKNGDWIVISNNGKGYARIEQNDYFQISFREDK